MNDTDNLKALVAGLISFLLSYLFNVYEYLKKIKEEREKEIESGKVSYPLLFLSWSIEGLIVALFSSVIFFPFAYYFPQINLIALYVASAIVARNAIGYIETFKRISSKKFEERLDEF